MKKSSPLKFVDLFAGIGGMRIGLEMSLKSQKRKSKCVFSSEINKFSAETYELNFGSKPEGDIRQIPELPEHDVLLAGFPCQAFSYAGKQKGFADTRGTLFFEIERLLRCANKKPRVLLLENVRGFTTHDRGRTFATVISRLEELGYSVRPLLLNSSDFGVPQNRVRVYLVCTLGRITKSALASDVGAKSSHDFKSRNVTEDLFAAKPKAVLVKDILEANYEKKYVCSKLFSEQLRRALQHKPLSALNGVRLIDYRGGNSIHSWELGMRGACSPNEINLMNLIISNRRKKHFGIDQDGKELTFEQISSFAESPDTLKNLGNLVQKGYLREKDGKYNPTCGNMSFEVFKFLDPESISITLVTSDAHRLGVVQNEIPRRITPRECARIQGFPDSFKVHPKDHHAYRQFGNSVSVPVIQHIFEDLFEHNSDIV